jgi:phenylpyruvate tautomerase PptA (4-oxalocrotonate tautomerase family)
MPILNFEIVGDVNKNELARSLADAAGKVLETKPGNTWVKLHFLPREHYAENGDLAEEVQPVFVSVLLGRCYDSKEHARAALEMTEAFATILNRPKENIHILFEPNAMGRIAFGGKLLTDS